MSRRDLRRTRSLDRTFHFESTLFNMIVITYTCRYSLIAAVVVPAPYMIAEEST